jgi:hypothetical protein
MGDGADLVALGADIASGLDAVGILVFAFRNMFSLKPKRAQPAWRCELGEEVARLCYRRETIRSI